MSADIGQLDEITARLRAEDAQLRRRTIWLTALPLIVGLVVLAGAWWGVEAARRQRSDLLLQNQTLQKQFTEIEKEKAALDERIATQQTAIHDLEVERAALDRDIASRKELLARFAPKLPAAQRDELNELEQGIDQVKSGNLDAAIKTYEKAIRDNAGDPLPYWLSGYAHYQAGQYDRAIDNLRQALQLDPKDAQSRYTLGLALWKLGSHEQQAAAEIRQAFEQDAAVKASAMQDPAYRPIRTYIDAGAGQASGRSAEEKAWIDKGLNSAKKGDFDSAITNYEAALQINPANWQVLHWLGYAAYRNKQYDKAIDSLQRALQIRPREGEIHYNLALALWKSGRQDQAIDSIRRAYEVEPAYRAIAEGDPQSKALRAAIPR